MMSVLTAVITLAMVPFLGIISIELNYSCNPSGTITVANPDSSTYIGAHAETQDQSQNCTVHVIPFMSVLKITDCPVSKNISLWLLKTSDLPAVLTDDIDYHILRCQQIPNTGVMRLLTDKSWVTNHISTTVEPTVTPKMLLSTHFEDEITGDVKETALVGETVMWEIDGPAGYTVLPLNCTANAGTGDGAVNIVLNGCSLDTYLLSHFDYKSETEKHILVAKLFAFRFASTTEVVVICDMLGCTNTSSACDFDCPSERRKRDKFGQYTNDHEQSYAQQSKYRRQRSSDLYGNSSASETAQIYGEVRGRLTVYSPSEYFEQLENGSKGLPRTSGLATDCILLILSSLVYKLNM